MEKLKDINLNPNIGERRGKKTVWASSQTLVEWVMSIEEKLNWLKEEAKPWKYIEGQYDSDGNLHPSGSPRICSYDKKEKIFIQKLFNYLNVESNIQQNNVWIAKSDSEKFFNHVEPILERRKS